MAGILDNKSRIMDVIITPLGRSQMASGRMKIEYASFSDRQIIYESGSSGALLNLTDRLYFEAAHTENDQIIYETDPDGLLTPFQSGEYQVNGQDVTYVSGSFAGTAYTGSIDLISETICNNATDHFRSHRIIGTRDLFKEDKGATFTISHATASFVVNDSGPLNEDEQLTAINQDDIKSVFMSSMFGHLKNFQFLPPMTKPHADAPEGLELGNYTQINTEGVSEWSTIESYLSKYDFQAIKFEETSGENNIICQIFEDVASKFEETASSLEKLVAIDYGSFTVESDRSAHVFFVGKLYRDSAGSLCFANLMTLVFDDEAE